MAGGRVGRGSGGRRWWWCQLYDLQTAEPCVQVTELRLLRHHQCTLFKCLQAEGKYSPPREVHTKHLVPRSQAVFAGMKQINIHEPFACAALGEGQIHLLFLALFFFSFFFSFSSLWREKLSRFSVGRQNIVPANRRCSIATEKRKKKKKRRRKKEGEDEVRVGHF